MANRGLLPRFNAGTAAVSVVDVRVLQGLRISIALACRGFKASNQSPISQRSCLKSLRTGNHQGPKTADGRFGLCHGHESIDEASSYPSFSPFLLDHGSIRGAAEKSILFNKLSISGWDLSSRSSTSPNGSRLTAIC